ncbi:hypothetical protein KN1_03410 [Stygiolobus caldivivus]|uniref:Uncharacterized protein n=1 Tax=Stygiolobus caldivivus TaxID=2824673 RepID=A0A8D5ZGQ7_9CREN|nr:hypothetical protein KN1_03410 [Stygiolobus caldivivus]
MCFKIQDLSDESLSKDYPEYFRIIKNRNIKLINGSVFSGIVDSIVLKIIKNLKHIDLLVNLYYTEIQLGLDLSYIRDLSFVYIH